MQACAGPGSELQLSYSGVEAGRCKRTFYRLKLFEVLGANAAISLDGRVPSDRPAGIRYLPAPADDLLGFKSRIAHSPGLAEKAEHVDAGAVDFAILVAANHQPIQVVDLAGRVIFMRRDRQHTVD